ncbi:MAG TPA: hypothetical protein P5287_02745 [bacterium]|nr:hypothetical protein [bacterium]
MKSLQHGVLEGLVSYSEEVKHSCKSYGYSGAMRKGLLKGEQVRGMLELSAVPDHLIEEIRRVRSLNGNMSRLGYDPLILKFYRSETKSRTVFDN